MPFPRGLGKKRVSCVHGSLTSQSADRKPLLVSADTQAARWHDHLEVCSARKQQPVVSEGPRRQRTDPEAPLLVAAHPQLTWRRPAHTGLRWMWLARTRYHGRHTAILQPLVLLQRRSAVMLLLLCLGRQTEALQDIALPQKLAALRL
jgi:hypothetical protein